MSVFVKTMIGKLIRLGRNNNKYTQDELAKISGYTKRAIQKFEAGDVSESMLKNFRLFRAIGLINDTSADDNQADSDNEA